MWVFCYIDFLDANCIDEIDSEMYEDMDDGSDPLAFVEIVDDTDTTSYNNNSREEEEMDGNQEEFHFEEKEHYFDEGEEEESDESEETEENSNIVIVNCTIIFDFNNCFFKAFGI